MNQRIDLADSAINKVSQTQREVVLRMARGHHYPLTSQCNPKDSRRHLELGELGFVYSRINAVRKSALKVLDVKGIARASSPVNSDPGMIMYALQWRF